ncbi:MAG: Na+:solute symporter [Flavobacteriales bacterium]|nr:Na+:solute symporter [Flavobacteriales bacterium]
MQTQLEFIDYAIIIGFFIVSLLIGVFVSRQSGKSSEDFFLSGRSMPWWLLGVSMVATTFAADTPGLVTDLVRGNGGVSANWVWWAFLLTGLLTVFFYSSLWRRSGITTDLEYYEMRYKGKSASFLRGFRAVYLGVIFNIITMAGVCLAGIKIGNILLGWEAWETLLYAGTVTVIYSAMGGLKSVLITDFFQFAIAMIGSVWATVYIVNLPEVGGLEALVLNNSVKDNLSILPHGVDTETLITLLIIPLAVQWWSVWYPGAEPGGGGYIAQRMLAAKNEKHATFATLFFNFAHYALRPWPWILVGLASLIVYPKLMTDDDSTIEIATERMIQLDTEVNESSFELFDAYLLKQMANDESNKEEYIRIQELSKKSSNTYQMKAMVYLYDQKSNHGEEDVDILKTESLVSLYLGNPMVTPDKLGHDLAYSAMVSKLPKGLIGLVVASLIAAFMSTISTQLNWGSSYIVNDLYKRFINKEASNKSQVTVGRISIVLLMLFAALLSLVFENAKAVFDIMLAVGAGTGLLFILRWFWSRINPYSEIAAMIISFIVAFFFFINGRLSEKWIDLPGYMELVVSVLITTAGWMIVTLLSKPTDEATMNSFNKKIFPSGNKFENFEYKITGFVAATFGIYAALFATGYAIYGELASFSIAFGVFVFAVGVIISFRKKMFG